VSIVGPIRAHRHRRALFPNSSAYYGEELQGYRFGPGLVPDPRRVLRPLAQLDRGARRARV